MASRCCGSRLSLPNQYDTKTPRASLWLAAARKPRYLRAVRRPPRDLARDVSRHELDAQRGSSVDIEMSLEKFPKFRQRKILKNSFAASHPPDSAFRPSARVLENVTFGEVKPQAVPKYRFLSGTSCLGFRQLRETRYS